jgi:hypothetical protein
LQALMLLDSSIDLGGSATDGSLDHPRTHEPDDELTQSILRLQGSLNKLGANAFCVPQNDAMPASLQRTQEIAVESLAVV